MQGFRLSPQQERVFRLRLDLYGQMCVTLPPDVDRAALRSALDRIGRRHEILRTTFARPAGVRIPVQVIGDDPAIAVDERTLPDEDAWTAWRDARARATVDLERGPQVRADLVTVAGRNSLLVTVPAAYADTPSLILLATELARAYAGHDDPDDVLQYADAAEWQHDLLLAGETAPGRQFWSSRPPARPVPLPFSRARTAGFVPASVDRVIDAATVERAGDLAASAGTGVPQVVLAAWRILLRLVADGNPAMTFETANRRHPDLRDAVGPLSLALPLDAGPDGDIGFRDAVAAVATAVAAAERWPECYDPRAATDHVEAAFAWSDAGDGALPAEGWALVDAVTFAEPFAVRLRGGVGPTLHLDFDRNRVSDGDAGTLLDMLLVLLTHAVTRPGDPVSALGRALGRAFDDPTASDPPAETATVTLTEALRAHAETHGDDPAVVDASATVSYRELRRRTIRLSRALRGHGVGRGTPVAVACGRDADTLVGMLGVMAAGGYCVPVDETLPPLRLAAMCAQIDCPVIVVPAGFGGELPAALTRVAVDDPGTADVDVAAGADDLAYVIFTSGSTGTPKPVAVTHANISAYSAAMVERLGLRPGDAVTSPAALSADLAYTAVFPTLYAGGTVHLMSAAQATDPVAFGARMSAYDMKCLKITPSHLRALLDAENPAAVLPRGWLVLGGEACDPDLVRRVRALAPGCRVLNHYGPTETTVGALTFEVTGATTAATAVPVGRPLPHCGVRVLDAAGEPVAPWVPGEIHLGGTGVTRGYLGLPGSTAERFVPDPSRPGARLYRTGDRGRRLGDGNVVFLGRTDGQIKIRGFRVETGEVEAVLRALPEVHEAAVVARSEPVALAAFVVPTGSVTTAELDVRLRRRLPDHMVPATIALVDALPRTASGKIDRRALAEAALPAARPEYEAPRGPIEEVLASVFAEVLGLDKVGRTDNFFAIGGDSILSIRAVARAARSGVRLTPPQLFQHQSVAALAEVLASAPADGVRADQGTVTGPLPATPVQRWLLARNPGFYHQVVVLDPAIGIDVEHLDRALRALAVHHDGLRLEVRPGGDLRIADVDRLPVRLARRVEGSTEEHVQAVHRDLAPDSGCLLRGLHLTGPDGDRVVLVAHHLAVDAVSWHVLIEDLAAAYAAAARGEVIALPPKTTDMRTIARRLAAYATDDAVTAQLDGWTGVLADVALAGLGGTAATNTYGNARSASITVPAAELLNPGPHGDRSPHVVLLAATGRALAAHTGRARVALDVEGHGRDLPWSDVDVSRTVGWFTTMYPLTWESRADDAPAAALGRVARAWARVPDGGLGYGLLRHVRTDAATDGLRRAAGPAVRFNYLGRLDTGGDGGPFRVLDEPTGPPADPDMLRPYLIDITASVLGERLTVTATYDPDAVSEGAMRRLVQDIGQAVSTLTASDSGATFAESGLSDDDLAGLLDLMAEDDA